MIQQGCESWKSRYIIFALQALLLHSFFLTNSEAHATQKNNKEGTTDKPGYQVLKERIGTWATAAHQGGLFYYEPNTIQQFEYAYKKGVQIVEMDLRITKDNIPVVYHDPDLGSWTDCTGFVKDYTWKELQHCRFKNNEDQRISSFSEVLKWSSGKIVVDAEFKDTETIEPALRLVKKYQADTWVYFQTQSSPDKFTLARKWSKTLGIEVALLFAVQNSENIEFVKSRNDPALLIVEVVPETRSPQLIREFQAMGKLVTEDAWHFRKDWEIFKAACLPAFQHKINIAVSNRVDGCVKQKKEFLGKM